jgi:hypothetical protein
MDTRVCRDLDQYQYSTRVRYNIYIYVIILVLLFVRWNERIAQDMEQRIYIETGLAYLEFGIISGILCLFDPLIRDPG